MHLAVLDVTKQFGPKMAVDDVSFEVPQGIIFGLLGPNGAGKTTLIRMLLDIMRPDSGTILYNGEPLGERMKERIGYLPEERGLYRKMRVGELLEYFARLKGLSRQRARQRLEEQLEKLEMGGIHGKRVEELSKGNQQKVQLAAMLVADPDVLVLDEPFSGLDPLNATQAKLLLCEEKRRGKLILLSTHQMNQAEELCDWVLMIHEGKRVLYGRMEETLEAYSESAFLLECSPLDVSLPFISRVEPQGRLLKVYPSEGMSGDCLIRALLERGLSIQSFGRARTSLEQIFVKVVKDSNGSEGGVQPNCRPSVASGGTR